MSNYDDVSRAVLRGLLYLNTTRFDGEERFQGVEREIARIREWARDLVDADVRNAYFSWLNYYERLVNRHREESVEDQRVAEVRKSVPKIPWRP